MQLIIRVPESDVFQRTLARPVRAITNLFAEASNIVDTQVGIYVSAIFAMEGDPAWASLAPLTQRNRILLGFSPEHPILFRTGSYKSAIMDRNSPNHIFQESRAGGSGSGGLRIRIGTRDPRFIELQEGTNKMPARPVVPSTDTAKRAFCLVLESTFITQLANLCNREEEGM